MSFWLIVLLGAVSLLVNWSGTNQLQKNIRFMGGNLERAQSVMVINDLLKCIRGSQLRLLAPDLSFLVRQQIYTDVDVQMGRLRQEVNHYDSLVEAGYDQDLLKEFHGQFIDWENNSTQYLKLSRELDATDILNPLKFQNTLLQYKEFTYEWMISLSDAITNEAPFKGVTTSAESNFGQWLFSLHSKNANLAVAIGRARKPLTQLFFSARKINTLILSDQEEVFELLNAVFESETMPAKETLFNALASMSAEADRAIALYGKMGTLANHMSQSFAGINMSLEGVIQNNRDAAAEIVLASHNQARKNTYISWIFLPLGILMTMLLSLFLARKMIRPIINLNTLIKRFVDENDFSIQATVSSNDEMGQVARSFNEMVQQFKFYYDELQARNEDLSLTQEKLEEVNLELEQHSRTLEQKVEERTDELLLQKQKMQELNTKLVHINDQLAKEVEGHHSTHEELRKARDVAQAADKTKSSFLANMSHEIRTPLNAVIGLTSLALKQDTSPKVHGYLHTVKRSAKLLLGIIEDILDFSKIEAGKLEMENINFSLHDVVVDLYEILRQKAEDKGLDFRCHVADDIPDLLIGDPLRLGQILMNLTGNSLKFTTDGEVRLSVTCESNSETEVALRFSVADTGAGIPKEKMDGLFEPFSQVDESISRTHGGTGLGLSISKKIVQQFRGDIWVESEFGLGSVFNFTVKLGRQANQNPVSQELGTSFAGSRVLIIDDNKMFRHFMAKMFTSVYFEVETAKGGRDGLGRLRDMHSLGTLPHIVFLDQSMPGMDGFEFLQILNDHPDFAAIPVVMISASGQNATLRKRAEKLGVRAVLTKPVKRKLLFSTIVTILGETDQDLNQQVVPDVGSSSDVLRGLCVLLVEDNSINRQVAYEVLVSGGALVDVAVDGGEAVEMMDVKYDAVLMDIQMPRMNGLDATTRIRENPDFDDIVIIAMTARAMKGDREKCLGVGMANYVSKPIEPEMLYSVLVSAVGEKADQPDTSAILPLDMGEIPGINFDKVMRLLNHNEKLFRSLLDEFCTDNQNVIAEIRYFFETGEVEQAVRVAHTLKGVAGNLGIDDVQALALSVEQGLRKSMLLESRLGELEDKLNELFEGVHALASVEQESPGAMSPLPDHEILSTVLSELSRHIQANTPHAEKYLNALPLYDDALYLKYRERILSYLDQFDFESARVVLVKMAIELGVSL